LYVAHFDSLRAACTYAISSLCVGVPTIHA
jgi:hypothetical protein